MMSRIARGTIPLTALALLGAGLVAVPAPATATVTSTSAAVLAQTLAGEGVTVSNVSLTGSAGLFEEADPELIGFERGVVLSTGNADYGSFNSTTGSSGTASGTGDPDLAGLTSGSTQDSTVLAFDVVPQADTMSFRYVFASEEYDEYVYQGFNDVFGFFVTRPGSTSKQNCAVVDTGSGLTPVSIDTINNGNPELPEEPARNPHLYRDNVGGGLAVEPDGFTTVLECVARVTPFQANRLKLAITDVGDTVLDSWVFVEAASVTSIPDCTITGTEGHDVLKGTPGADIICGLGGHDILFGAGGHDVLLGGPGEDSLIAGPGNDRLFGGEDNDALRGDAANDIIDGGDGLDLVTYFTATGGGTVDLAANKGSAPGHGTDTLQSIENAFGTKYADKLFGNGRINQLYGGPGNDLVNGRGGPDLVVGTAGNDTVRGEGGADLVYGGRGVDNVDGGAGNDTCYQGGGKRTSCERGNDLETANTGDQSASALPVPGTDTPTPGQPGSTSTTIGTRVVARASDGALGTGSSRWYIGNHDYVVVFSSTATRQITQWSSAGGWQGGACYFIKGHLPLKAACSATNALQTVEKLQLKWFLNRAKAGNGCAIAILDYGRHGILQQKKWKTRPATSYRYRSAQLYVSPGRVTAIKTSDPGEVGGKYINVLCK